MTFLEEEHWLEAMVALSKCGSKAKRELKNLECSVNYDATSECSSRGKGKVRACPVLL